MSDILHRFHLPTVQLLHLQIYVGWCFGDLFVLFIILLFKIYFLFIIYYLFYGTFRYL